MAVYKDGDKWRVVFRFSNWKGERKQTQKRGFTTKKEAQMWEREELLKQGSKLDMTFESFFEIYEVDKKKRVKENTWESKSHVIQTKILPYFGQRKIGEIEAKDIIAWQNELLAYKGDKGEWYSPTYLKTIHSQLSAIFNHAVRFYHLPFNPAQKAGTMGSEEHKEMLFWTKEEYLKFADAMMDKPVSYYAFEILYWCGVRMGEMLALTPKDFDFNKCTLTINKSYQRLKGKDVITSPKTPKSNRIIKMPKFLCEEMQEYISMLYEAGENEQMESQRQGFMRVVQQMKTIDEQEIQPLKARYEALHPVFKAKERKELEKKLNIAAMHRNSLELQLSSSIEGVGYRNIRDFMEDYNKYSREVSRYETEVSDWERECREREIERKYDRGKAIKRPDNILNQINKRR